MTGWAGGRAQDEREQELAPAEQEGDDGGRGDAGADDRDHDRRKPAARRAVDEGRLLEPGAAPEQLYRIQVASGRKPEV